MEQEDQGSNEHCATDLVKKHGLLETGTGRGHIVVSVLVHIATDLRLKLHPVGPIKAWEEAVQTCGAACGGRYVWRNRARPCVSCGPLRCKESVTTWSTRSSSWRIICDGDSLVKGLGGRLPSRLKMEELRSSRWDNHQAGQDFFWRRHRNRFQW